MSQDAPVIQGFIPVNRPFASGVDSLQKSSTASTLVERSEKKKDSVGKAGTIVRQPRKRNRIEVKTSDSVIAKSLNKPRARNPRPSISHENPKCNDISKTLQQTKPGIPHNVPPQKAFATSNYPPISQGTFHKDPLDCLDNENPQRSVWASSATIIGTSETLMEKMVDDDASINNLNKRSSVLVKGLFTQEEAMSHSCPAPQGLEQTSIRSRIDEHQVPLKNEDFFSHMNDDDFPMSDDDFPMSDQEDLFKVDCNGKNAIDHSSHIDDDDFPISDQEEFLEVDCNKQTAVNDISHIDDDDFPTNDLEDFFDFDHNRNSQPIANNDDVLVYEDAEALTQDPFADEELDIELSNLSIPALKRDDDQLPPLAQLTPLRSPAQKAPAKPYTSCKRKIRVSSVPHCQDAEATGARKPLRPIPSPNTASHRMPSTPNGSLTLATRPPFPSSVLRRSPITGLSPDTVLRTCFSIDEAIKAASISKPDSADALIELYCRSNHSDREPDGYKQFFQFLDLVETDIISPILEGVYAIWKGVELWDFDSGVFLGDKGKGKMARVVGRMKKGEGDRGWELTVLNIWEASWEDVGAVKGIICA
ncbi:MAG: hypothetical protein Q9195_000185 [Heterodermia aff. obscurata]